MKCEVEASSTSWPGQYARWESGEGADWYPVLGSVEARSTRVMYLWARRALRLSSEPATGGTHGIRPILGLAHLGRRSRVGATQPLGRPVAGQGPRPSAPHGGRRGHGVLAL